MHSSQLEEAATAEDEGLGAEFLQRTHICIPVTALFSLFKSYILGKKINVLERAYEGNNKRYCSHQDKKIYISSNALEISWQISAPTRERRKRVYIKRPKRIKTEAAV